MPGLIPIIIAASLAASGSPQFDACLKTAKGMRATQHCASQEVALQERKLDRVFAALLKAHPRRHAQLRAEQAAWSDRKDAKCEVFSRRRGSLNSLKAMDCFRHEIIERRRALEKR
jgi:uncharacterized protein YecT (DUF1311 family)